MTESRISGAEEPRAMSVRFDTVSFQTLTVVTVVSPLGLVMVTSFSYRHREKLKDAVMLRITPSEYHMTGQTFYSTLHLVGLHLCLCLHIDFLNIDSEFSINGT